MSMLYQNEQNSLYSVKRSYIYSVMVRGSYIYISGKIITLSASLLYIYVQRAQVDSDALNAAADLFNRFDVLYTET